MKISVRQIAGLAIGCAAAIAIAGAGFFMLRTLWPAYAGAEPENAYTLAMLLARLSVGVVCAVGAACITTIVAADNGRAAWWLGGIFFVVSLPLHLYFLWSDYPAWYHFVYLSYLIPITGLTGRLFRRSTRPS